MGTFKDQNTPNLKHQGEPTFRNGEIARWATFEFLKVPTLTPEGLKEREAGPGLLSNGRGDMGPSAGTPKSLQGPPTVQP